MRISQNKKTIGLLFLILVAAFGGFWIGQLVFRDEFSFFGAAQKELNRPVVLYSLDKRANDQAIIDVINSAQKYVYFAVYTFTKNNIADALVGAKQRRLDVRGITDVGQAKTAYEKPIIKKLEAAGIQIETQKRANGLMHIKAVVTDREYAMGSYNWTESATIANDELLEIGIDDYLRGTYTDIIKKILNVNNDVESVMPKRPLR